jgi:NAD(P)-dependent dehydrogenase (short-subunit alcohol dehydrogenase family)
MSSDLTGKVALVTGASGGIGTALVEALVERGATVVATSRNHQNRPPRGGCTTASWMWQTWNPSSRLLHTVNLTAPFLLAQAALPDMVNRGYGRIMFTSSAAAFVGGFVGPHYAASKAALHGLVASLASNYAPYGVT